MYGQKTPLNDQQEIQDQKEGKQELKGLYKKWLDEDVHWIITDQERREFKALSSDEERNQFIEQFWLRRDPNPGSPENAFRKEYYARIAYANKHFAAGKPGWLTDRGHIYIAYGQPDRIDSHPGGQYMRPPSEGGGMTDAYPFETWHYGYLEGVGSNIDLEFVDSCQCGDYHFTIDRGEKDALKDIPGAGLTWGEAGPGKPDSGKQDRLGLGPEHLGKSFGAQRRLYNDSFDRIALGAAIMGPPPIKSRNKNLDAFITTSKVLPEQPLLFDVRTDYVKTTKGMILVPMTLQIRNRDITFTNKGGVAIGTVHILGQVSDLNHKPIQTYFEDTVDFQMPSESLERMRDNFSVYWKSLPLRPGLYNIDIAITDVNKPNHVGTWRRSINVPSYDDGKLATSSLILADQMEQVPSKDIGAGNFVIGDTKILPSVTTDPATPVTFHRQQSLNLWMQVYNLGIDHKSKQNDATIDYQIMDLTTNESILQIQELTSKVNPDSDQVTLEKSLPLADLQPGEYQLSIKINDGVSKQQIAESASFVID